MSDIRSIITDKPIVTQIATNMMRDEYVTCVGMNPSSLASGLVGIDDVNPSAIKLAWEAPDSIARTPASQDSLDRGTLAHLFVLQPELLAERVAVWSGGKRIGKEWDAFVDAHPGRLLIKSTDHAAVAKATNVMRSLPEVNELIRDIETEVAMFGSVPCPSLNAHMLVKGQVDAVNRRKHTIVDLKTTEAGIDRRAVNLTIRRFHYREKMSMYRQLMAEATGTDPDVWQCFNVFMSLTPPYGVVVAKFVNFALEWGESRMSMARQSVEQCLAADHWPMYSREMFVGVEEWELNEESVEVDYGS